MAHAAAGGIPIVPMHIESSRQWILKSWDGHRFPKPFSTIHIGFGDPIFIKRVTLEDNIEKVALEVEETMVENVRQIQTHLHS